MSAAGDSSSSGKVLIILGISAHTIRNQKLLPSSDTAAPGFRNGLFSMWGAFHVRFHNCNAPRGAVQLGLVIIEATSLIGPLPNQIDNSYKAFRCNTHSNVPYSNS